MTNNKELAISVSNVSKSFKLPHEQQNSLKGALLNFHKKRGYEIQHALKDISFEVKKGEFFGIVGRNGSGKSTLLKLLAGIYSPNSGIIKVNGRLTPFIELGVGFNPELSGRDNVFLNGALLGFNRQEIAKMYDDIVAFAELERFMDQKLKNYSSGMQVRLAFSVAIQARSDILLLDEVLAVGDSSFQKKCFDYFRELKKNKQTVVFISHDMNAVREYCDRAILIEKGQVTHEGNSDKIAQHYTRLFIGESDKKVGDQNDRWGSGKITVEEVNSKVRKDFIEITATYKVHEDTKSPIFGLSIFNPIGTKIFESNTKWKKVKTGSYKKNDSVTVAWKIADIFTNGDNTITATAADFSAQEIYDWWDEAKIFTIDKDEVTSALTLPQFEVEIV